MDEPTRNKLRDLARHSARATKQRDVAIMEAVEAGIDLRTVADVVRLAHITVRDIAMRERDLLEERVPRHDHYPDDAFE